MKIRVKKLPDYKKLEFYGDNRLLGTLDINGSFETNGDKEFKILTTFLDLIKVKYKSESVFESSPNIILSNKSCADLLMYVRDNQDTLTVNEESTTGGVDAPATKYAFKKKVNESPYQKRYWVVGWDNKQNRGFYSDDFLQNGSRESEDAAYTYRSDMERNHNIKPCYVILGTNEDKDNKLRQIYKDKGIKYPYGKVNEDDRPTKVINKDYLTKLLGAEAITKIRNYGLNDKQWDVVYKKISKDLGMTIENFYNANLDVYTTAIIFHEVK